MSVLQRQLLIVMDNLEINQLIRERLEKLTIKIDCAAQANALIELYLEADAEIAKSVPIAFGTDLVIAPRCRQV